MYIKIKYIILLFIFFSGLNGQRDFDEELKYQNKSIESLKKEIDHLKLDLEEISKREKSETEKIFLLEKEIILIDQLILELIIEEKSTKNNIIKSRAKITDYEKELNLLRDRYSKRSINAYKYSQPTFIENVMSNISWRKSLYRRKYIKSVSKEEKKINKKIKSLLIEVGQEKLNKEAALRRSVSLNREKDRQKEKLKHKKHKRENVLTKISKNKYEITQHLDEKSKGLNELEELRKSILEDKARFERQEKIRKQQEALRSKQFSQLKGQLPWPIKGKVVTKFGKQWNKKLKTTTDYPGIDIQSQENMPVYSILNGVVATITYLRGYGTTIIIDHGGGFYTVYSQVKSIKTNINSEVKSGDIIALVSESENGEKPVLHFEIWGNGEKLNPEKWLLK